MGKGGELAEGKASLNDLEKKAASRMAAEKVEKKAAKKPVGQGKREPVKKASGSDLKAFLQKNLLAVTGVVCIVAIALVWSLYLVPEEVDIEDFWGKEAGTNPLKMIVVTSERCPGCEFNSSLEVLFKANGVPYAIEKVEESSLDGQKLVQVAGIKKLPAFIIEGKSLSDSMLVKTESGIAPLRNVLNFYVSKGKGSFKEDIFAFSEMNLDGIIRTELLLEEPCGNKENLLIQYFADPYDPNTIKVSKDYENMRHALESTPDINVFFLYNYLPTYSNILQNQYLEMFGGKPEVVGNNLRQAAKYLICANDAFGTEKFNEMQEQMYSVYCEIDQNAVASGAKRPLADCSDSNHFNAFLTGEELQKIAEGIGIFNEMAFSACFFSVDEKMGKMQLVAKAAEIERTPTILVNCQYETSIDRALDAVCQINSEPWFCRR